MSAAVCRECDIELDESDIINAGMDNICHPCWCEEYQTLGEKGEQE